MWKAKRRLLTYSSKSFLGKKWNALIFDNQFWKKSQQINNKIRTRYVNHNEFVALFDGKLCLNKITGELLSDCCKCKCVLWKEICHSQRYWSKAIYIRIKFTIVNWRNEYMTGSDHFSAFKYENIIIECNELI